MSRVFRALRKGISRLAITAFSWCQSGLLTLRERPSGHTAENAPRWPSLSSTFQGHSSATANVMRITMPMSISLAACHGAERSYPGVLSCAYIGRLGPKQTHVITTGIFPWCHDMVVLHHDTGGAGGSKHHADCAACRDGWGRVFTIPLGREAEHLPCTSRAL